LLATNPCASIRAPRVPRKEARYLEPDEARRMLQLARGGPLEGAIVLGLIGGLRIGEVCAVRWGSVDLEEGRLLVRGSYWARLRAAGPEDLPFPIRRFTDSVGPRRGRLRSSSGWESARARKLSY